MYPIKGTTKWKAQITANGVRHYLGAFPTAEAAHVARIRAAKKFYVPPVFADPRETRNALLQKVRVLYKQHGMKALSTPFLEKQKGALYPALLRAGLKQPALLKALGLADEYAAWRDQNRTYRGSVKPKWSWEAAVEKARQLVKDQGDLPSVELCRRNHLSSLTSAVFRSGKTWEDLRKAVGLGPSTSFCPSRNGMRWRSRPEASFSDFLYARGIEHIRGKRYPAAYAKQSGRLWGQFDLHFRTPHGIWIDVEIWGDPLNKLSRGRYQRTRALKEKWHRGNANFLGIPYQDCLTDARLTEILTPYIGIIEPHRFEKPADRLIETSHWSDADELLATCKQIAQMMPDGLFPSESWLRKRGKHAHRTGPNGNSIAVYVQKWLGGTRNVRELLGQGHASTMQWTFHRAIEEWRRFEREHSLTPSQCSNARRRGLISSAVAAEGHKIYCAARLMGVLDQARRGQTARKIKWTPEHTLSEWKRFYRKHRRSPSECMSAVRRQTLPKSVTDQATRIYDAARRLGILDVARATEHRANKPV